MLSPATLCCKRSLQHRPSAHPTRHLQDKQSMQTSQQTQALTRPETAQVAQRPLAVAQERRPLRCLWGNENGSRVQAARVNKGLVCRVGLERGEARVRHRQSR